MFSDVFSLDKYWETLQNKKYEPQRCILFYFFIVPQTLSLKYAHLGSEVTVKGTSEDMHAVASNMKGYSFCNFIND